MFSRIIKNFLSFNTIVIGLSIILFFNIPATAQSKIQSGNWSVSPSLADYSLDRNNGERSMTIEIKFKESFKQKPNIFITVTQVDADKKLNVRYQIETISVSRDGYTLKVKTWADSRVFSISGNWFAYQN
jgi:hypothetical protein